MQTFAASAFFYIDRGAFFPRMTVMFAFFTARNIESSAQQLTASFERTRSGAV
jgi:hypothetical protein